MKPPAPPVRADGLQIDEHPRFQAGFWMVERLAWGSFIILIIGALLGLTGAGGPFSTRVVEVGGARVEYTQIARWQSPAQISVEWNGVQDASRADIWVSLDDAYSDGFAVESITPAPLQARLSRGQHAYQFPGDANNSRVTFDLTARTPGFVHYRLQVGDEVYTIQTLILP